MEKKNSLVSIGYTGVMRCYLNISGRDAIERYIKSENISEEQFNSDDGIQFRIIEFDDEFNAYSVWG